jgi:hypothetical protein
MNKAAWLSGIGTLLLAFLVVLWFRMDDTKQTSSSSLRSMSSARQNAGAHDATSRQRAFSRFSQQSEEERRSLLRDGVKEDPNATAAWTLALPPGELRDQAIQQVALAWQAEEEQAAWNWASSLEPASTRDATMMALAYELTRHDPALAFARAQSIAEGAALLPLIEHIVANWALQDPATALTEVRNLPHDDQRHAALVSLTTSWAESNPAAAATLAVESLPAGPQQNRAVAAIVQRWAQQDPEAVEQWVATFPDGPIKENALEHIEHLAH